MTFLVRRATLALGIITLLALIHYTYNDLSRYYTVSLPTLLKPHLDRLGGISAGHIFPTEEAPHKSPSTQPRKQPLSSKESQKSDKEIIEYSFTTTSNETTANALTYPGRDIQKLLAEQTAAEDEANRSPGAGCPDLPVEMEKVLIVILTGATEVYQKLPTLLLTTLRCLPKGSYLVFSDLEQVVAGVPVRDALADISDGMEVDVVDFEMYRKINTTYAEVGDVSALSNDWKTGAADGSTPHDPHNLDKWKWLPSLAASYDFINEQNHFASKSKHRKTKKEWVFVMDDDTYLSISNLMLWLGELGKGWPGDQEGGLIYAGAQLSAGNIEYARGDGGVLLSMPVVEKIYRSLQMPLAKGDWEKRTNMGCCGDVILAEALANHEVPLLGAFPLLQAEAIASLDWTSRHWCSPVVTWRGSIPQELEALWRFEQEMIGSRGWERPILYRDVFAAFVQQHLEAEKAKWTNLSEEVADIVTNPEDAQGYQLQESESKDRCRSACESRKDCLQWMFGGRICTLSNVVRLGHRVEGTGNISAARDNKTQVISGWMLDRINEWIVNADRECKEEGRWTVSS